MNTIMNTVYSGSVVGTSFEPAKSNIPQVLDYLRTIAAEQGEIIPVMKLVHNPENPYDKNAIQVHMGYRNTMFFVGHIPKTHNSKLLEIGLPNVQAEFDRFYFDDNGQSFGLAVFINLKQQEAT